MYKILIIGEGVKRLLCFNEDRQKAANNYNMLKSIIKPLSTHYTVVFLYNDSEYAIADNCAKVSL